MKPTTRPPVPSQRPAPEEPEPTSEGHLAGLILEAFDDAERVRVGLMYALDSLGNDERASLVQIAADISDAMLDLWRLEGVLKSLAALVVGGHSHDTAADIAPRLARASEAG